MKIIKDKNYKFKQLQRLFIEVAYEDRDKLIHWAVKEKGYTLQEVANVIDMTRERIRQIVRDYGTSKSY